MAVGGGAYRRLEGDRRLTALLRAGVDSFDTFCPLGPVAVTADEIPDQQACGEFMDPPRSLAAGDLLEAEIGGIGALRNPVVAVVSSPWAVSRHEKSPVSGALL